MRMIDLIAKKRDHEVLTTEEINFIINEYTADRIPDYQVSALLMAIYLNGMTDAETSALAKAMLDSGEVLNLDLIPGIKVDKHSTGGVGDKISIPLAPLVASAGVKNPMISGRGLGHTGGTLDKLEAIPGYDVDETVDQFIKQVSEHGTAIISATKDVAPADRKIYALRDVTSTVESIPLIASSIMSKKLASGTNALVLDVKTGNGAFMKTEERARKLAETLVAIGRQNNVPCVAYLTDMNQPLGYAIGNANEIKESIAVLRGEGPEDVTELTLILGAEMLVLAGISKTTAQARAILEDHIKDGSALAAFKQLITDQGGDASIVDHPEKLPQADGQVDVIAQASGYITAIETNELGLASVKIGGGRAKKDDIVDPAVGIMMHKKLGDAVKAGEPLATLYVNTEAPEEVQAQVLNSFTIGETKPELPPLIHEVIR
ncbi:MAG TPA: pyrimidine-nucleoside phosphorylase [Lapidilactobacillus dextrinicus]|uniref:Pyrimidine-nucleoside phosphorylase n=2 Tax=Lapidilactobacillus dextrinicus TaxID=51664 RepID=A0A0R2BLM3_9LACO|nr:pyrimidine-nucleoside phosphorylase [Lapidilactobacillus dextrinicus]KRM78740.1 pyrimidine-nucleoside phosphorylase [Lapidilactobacillus dextrinicus DSM 20335]QFG47463.1 pyrimidine-nucleoside phosphorylase [Lapidilactobacillus dextrinicus]HJE15099.1 pyrimidine-nucleoside phosphorylase [Lapidilactobacillus dextrinicus]